MPDRVKDGTLLGLFRNTVLFRQIRQDHWPECAPTVIFWADVSLHESPPVEDDRFPRSVERRSPVDVRYLAQLPNHAGFRREPQNRAIDRRFVLPTQNIIVMEINRSYEIKVEIGPIAQSLRLHGIAEKIRAERGPAAVKVSRERVVRNHLVRVADLHAVRNAAEFFRSIGVERERVANGQRRDQSQALHVTELIADPQRIQSIEHCSPADFFLIVDFALSPDDSPRTRPIEAPTAILAHDRVRANTPGLSMTRAGGRSLTLRTPKRSRRSRSSSKRGSGPRWQATAATSSSSASARASIRGSRATCRWRSPSSCARRPAFRPAPQTKAQNAGAQDGDRNTGRLPSQ